MPRPRINDPKGLSDAPRNVVVDPARVQPIIAEFRRKLAFVEGSYRSTVRAIGSDQDFNRSLKKLHRSLNRKRPSKRCGDRAHPEVEMVIIKHAMDHASTRADTHGAQLTQEDINFGARKAAELLRPRRRSTHRILSHYVRGLMALIQELTGKPVLLTHNKDNLYDPQAVNLGGRILLMMAQHLDPKTEATTVATIVKQARRDYARQRMPFTDFFPMYGQDLSLLTMSGPVGPEHQVVAVLPFCPIYFP